MGEITEQPTNPSINTQVQTAKIELRKAIVVALITAISGIITGYIAIPHKMDPLKQQGFGTIKLQGKWKYICTSFDGSYQHGGRFVVQEEKNGSLILNGERMWRDNYNAVTRQWSDTIYKESDFLQWQTNWIAIRNDTKMDFEYRIPMQDKDIIGYCTGIINSDASGNVVSVKGHFYVLNQAPILTGQIIFKHVTDDDYNSTSTLPKNH